jgi:hypothetical protein
MIIDFVTKRVGSTPRRAALTGIADPPELGTLLSLMTKLPVRENSAAAQRIANN